MPAVPPVNLIGREGWHQESSRRKSLYSSNPFHALHPNSFAISCLTSLVRFVMFFAELCKYRTPTVSASTSILAREPRTPFHPPLRSAQQVQGMISTRRQVSWAGNEGSTSPIPHLYWGRLMPRNVLEYLVLCSSTNTVIPYPQENQQSPVH